MNIETLGKYAIPFILAGCGYCSKEETPPAPAPLEQIAGASMVQNERVDASYAAQDFGRPDAGIKCGEGEFLDYWGGTAVCLAELEGSSFCGEYCGTVEKQEDPPLKCGKDEMVYERKDGSKHCVPAPVGEMMGDSYQQRQKKLD